MSFVDFWKLHLLLYCKCQYSRTTNHAQNHYCSFMTKSVSTVTRPGTGRLRRCSKPGKAKRLLFSPPNLYRPWSPPSLQSNVYRPILTWGKATGEWSLHLVQNLGIRWDQGPSSGNRVGPCGRTDRHRHDEVNILFRNFANAPNSMKNLHPHNM